MTFRLTLTVNRVNTHTTCLPGAEWHCPHVLKMAIDHLEKAHLFCLPMRLLNDCHLTSEPVKQARFIFI